MSCRPFNTVPIGGEFGISVEFNTLDDVIDYEEGRINLTQGYPRFVPHRAVTARERAAAAETGMPFAVAFPSRRQALFVMRDFSQRFARGVVPFSLDAALEELIAVLHPGAPLAGRWTDTADFKVVDGDRVTVVCARDKDDHERLKLLRRVWGFGFDVHAVAGRAAAEPEGFSEAALAQRLAALEGPRANGALLFQSGMAAISTIVVGAARFGRRMVVVGPAYVDTCEIASKWPAETRGLACTWLPEDAGVELVDAAIRSHPSVVFFEAPTNPRLTIPDIPGIVRAARERGAILGADATIATPFNWRPLEHGFDFVMHSTSKFLSGRYDHLGGVITAASTELLGAFAGVRDALDLSMSANQMKVLFGNMRGFERRMETINRNAAEIARRLAGSPAVAKVFHPGTVSPRQEEMAAAFLKPGRSGLLSFVLKDGGREALRRFYDNVTPPVRKGPGLGGESTMLCPYVMLAHYHADPAFLASQKLDFHLVRVSVGTEPVDDIWEAMRLP
ncbi:MAG: PLP-dependent transferase [Deltaproteobacteria bacterium]|nr:PLP-dependent transferase [Deltaproteobacteria bacterium]